MIEEITAGLSSAPNITAIHTIQPQIHMLKTIIMRNVSHRYNQTALKVHFHSLLSKSSSLYDSGIDFLTVEVVKGFNFCFLFRIMKEGGAKIQKFGGGGKC